MYPYINMSSKSLSITSALYVLTTHITFHILLLSEKSSGPNSTFFLKT
ncbi:hypothetical protein LCGC14_2494510, partial [marine sediment metagenome]